MPYISFVLLAGLAALLAREAAQRAPTSGQPDLPRWFWMRGHWRVFGLLLLYSLTSLALPLNEGPAPIVMVVRTLPLVVGVCGVWWELRQGAMRATRATIVEQSILLGLIVVALPALIGLGMVIGQAWLAWRTGALGGIAAALAVGQALLRFTAVSLGMGISVGVLGAGATAWLTDRSGQRPQGGPPRPSAWG